MPKLKIDDILYSRLKEVSATAGYSSVDEFVQHVLEKEVADSEVLELDPDITKRLNGLGYIS